MHSKIPFLMLAWQFGIRYFCRYINFLVNKPVISGKLKLVDAEYGFKSSM